MNDTIVAIMVDREENPDIAEEVAIAMEQLSKAISCGHLDINASQRFTDLRRRIDISTGNNQRVFV